ncbi:hypothetical protein CEXT_784361 [Caerostris extrusa]|uniref:Uncharacterized protein n=1 Tax=Caerostris extrusa TaxID=172846 RepID=A0AAV4R183_CAEEX|nr:hypothetical protein CEXT_784361 [Caerostris extrusa]
MILIPSSVREMHFLMAHTPLSEALHQSLECLSNRRMKHLAAIHQFCNSKCVSGSYLVLHLKPHQTKEQSSINKHLQGCELQWADECMGNKKEVSVKQQLQADVNKTMFLELIGKEKAGRYYAPQMDNIEDGFIAYSDCPKINGIIREPRQSTILNKRLLIA